MTGEAGQAADDSRPTPQGEDERNGEPEEFRVRRRLNAPPETVFQYWTEPARIALWWGPRELTTLPDSVTVDLRTGGDWRAELVATEDGSRWTMAGTYRDVSPPDRLVFTWGVVPGSGQRVNPTALITVTLSEHPDGGTDLVLHQAGQHSAEERESMLDGWASCLDRLVTLPGAEGEAA